MTLFYLCAALLVVLCLLWLLVGLFTHTGDSLDQETVNVTLARERGDTLAAALKDGSIDQATYDYEREQLDYDLAADLEDTNKLAPKSSGHIAAAVLVTLFVPLAAGALYLQLGNPAGINKSGGPGSQFATNNSANASAQMPGALSSLLPRLEERLASSPDDVQGFRLLGRSYLSIGNFSRAQYAFEKALSLDENDVATMAQLAESIAMGQNGELAGEPMTLLDRALTLKPMHEHSLWLRSIGLQQAGDHEQALLGFNLLMGLAKDDPDAIATVDQIRSHSIQALAGNTIRQQASGDNTTNETSRPTVHTGPSIEVAVSLAPNVASVAAADSAVFIYATATNGPPMPLAVTKLSVKDLPTTVVLDDSMAMIPDMKLSSFTSVTVGARVSASGNPIAQPGDWFTESTNITILDTPDITLTIDKQTP